MSDSWDDAAGNWDDDPAARAYSIAAMDSLRAALDERGVSLAGAQVCDFGCGTGLLTEQLVDTVESIDAVDTSRSMLDVLDAKIAADEWSTIRTQTEIPTSNGSFDLVVCSSVCSFLDDYPRTTRQLAGLLRPSGVFVQWDWERELDDEHGLTRTEIVESLTGASLGNLRVDTAFEVEFEGHVMRPLIGIGQRS